MEYLAGKKPVPEVVSPAKLLELQRQLKGEEKYLFSLLALSAGRISEILTVVPEQLKMVIEHKKEFLVLENLVTRKNRHKPFRTLVIARTEWPVDGVMAKELYDWVSSRDAGSPLFGYSRSYASHLLARQLGIEVKAQDLRTGTTTSLPDFRIRPHYLRHCRLTHLVQYFEFNDLKLQLYAGWASSAMAQRYVQYSVRELAHQMAFVDLPAPIETPTQDIETV